MKKLVFMLAIVFVFASTVCLAQGFAEPYPFPSLGDHCRVILKSGEEIKGKWFGMTGTPKNLKNIQITKPDGREKYLTTDVKRIYVTMSGLAKWTMLMDKSTVGKKYSSNGWLIANPYNKQQEHVSISKAMENWDAIMNNTTEIIFDMVSEEEGKYGMRQLLNPGFDQGYRVYTWSQVTKDFMLIDSQDKVFLIKNKTYQADFKTLFANCPSFVESFEKNNTSIDFDDIAFHVFIHSQACVNDSGK